MPLTLHINGTQHELEAAPDQTLLSTLRDNLGLTGTKYGCGEGECGACTVLLDGKAAKSCRVPVKAVAGKKITTIEGLELNGKLHPVQQAFLKTEAFQCGYCTPGMIMAAVSLLKQVPDPNDADIIKYMDGNVCRCGAYLRIMTAVREAARSR